MKIICLFILALFFQSVFAQVETSIRPNPPIMGQELQLIIRQYGKNNSILPDFSSLHQDFNIIGTQQSVSYEWINGKSQRENIWTLILMPKHDGKISIPSLMIGDEKTEMINIEIQKPQIQANHINHENQTTFLDWRLSLERPVVHEQVNLTVKIYHLQPLLDAKLQAPTVKNGLLFALEQALRYFEVKNGERYEVEEYRYVIYPQQAGKITVTPPVLDAIEYGVAPKSVHASLKPLTMFVEAPPIAQTASTWLPAQKVLFHDLKPLSHHIGIPVGDTVVRQLQITAIGIPAQLIPDITVPCGKGCKVYMNPPKISNKMENGSLSGRKTYDITYLFNEPGETNIPTIELPWFNTSTRSLEILKIPGVDVDIFVNQKNKINADKNLQTKPTTHLNSWIFAILGFFGGGLLMKWQSAWSWQKGWRYLKGIEFEYYALKKACLQHEAEKARIEILAWAKKAGFKKNIYDLHDIIAEVPPGDFQDELKILMTFLFSRRQDEKWQGIRFWRAFKAFKFKQKVFEQPVRQSLKLNP